MTATIVISRILGFVREMVIARQFGATDIADTFWAAMKIPDLLYFLVCGGALSAAMVPVFCELIEKGDKEELSRTFSVIATVAITVMVVLVVLGEILAPQLTAGVFSRFSPEQTELATAMTRIVMPQPMMMLVMGMLAGVLYSVRRFWAPATAPIVYNVGIICGAAFLGSVPGIGVKGIAWGVVAGGLAGPVLIPLLAVRRTGIRFRPSFDVGRPAVRRIGVMLLPVMFTLSLVQLYPTISGFFTQGRESWLSQLQYGHRLMAAPVAIFAQGIAIAAYPTISAYAARRDTPQVVANLSFALRTILFLTVPATVYFIALRVPLIRVLFERGMFTPEATAACADVLAYYSIGICFFSVQGMITRGFFAIQDIWTPLRASLAAACVFVAANIVLREQMGVNGLALAASIAAMVHTGLLVLMLRRRIGAIDGTAIARSLGKFIVAGASMWVVIELTARRLPDALSLSFGGSLIQLIVSFVVGGSVYVAIAWALRSGEVTYAADLLKRRLGGGR